MGTKTTAAPEMKQNKKTTEVVKVKDLHIEYKLERPPRLPSSWGYAVEEVELRDDDDKELGRGSG
jgi:hypothetical protein